MSTIVKERSNVLNVEVSKRNDVRGNVKGNDVIEISRGDLVFVELPENENSSVQGKSRICIVISNNRANLHSPVISIVPLTSRMSKRPLPTHVLLEVNDTNKLRCNSVALAEQITTVDRKNIKFKTGKLTDEEMEQVEWSVMVQLGL